MPIRAHKNEIDLMRQIQVQASSAGARLWRNQVGTGLMVRAKSSAQREEIIRACQALAEKLGGSAPRVTFGLPTGSGDLVGFVPHTVTTDDVGKRLPLFACPEVKTRTGRLSDEQKHWRDYISSVGGAWAELRGIDELEQWLAQHR